MQRFRPLFALFALSLTAGACSDGGLGANGLVRFSQVVDFKETDSFDAPFMVNKTMMIALQDPESDKPLTAETTFTELDLTVDAEAFGTAGETFPLGFAQYAVVLDGEGDYRLVANENGEELDYMKIKAQNVKSMRLSKEVLITTDGTDCTQSTTSELDDITLHNNQTLQVYVVPLNEDDEPMLGLLNLTASGSSNVELDAPLAGHGMPANALYIDPKSDLDEDITLSIKELTEEFEIEVTINTKNDDAEVSCD